MKFSFKKIAAGALALALTLSMAACKKDGSGTESTSPESTTAPGSELMEFDYMGEDLTKYVTLGKYKGLEISIPKKATVTDQDVLDQIDFDFIASKMTVKVTDRAVTEDDTVFVSFKGFIDGVQFQGGTGDKDYFTVYDGGGYIDGFAKGLVGVMPGVETELNLKFPENYHTAENAGKDVLFKVTVNCIYEAVELTDTTARELTGDSSMTVESICADYKKKMQETVDNRYDDYKISIALQRVMNLANEIELPKDLVDSYYNAEIKFYQTYADMYETSLENILASNGYTKDSLYKSVKNSIFSEMVIYSVIKAENITITDAEYAERMKQLAIDSNSTEEEILKSNSKEKLVNMFTHSKALDVIASLQNFTVEEGVAEDPDIDFLNVDLTKYIVLGEYKGLTIKVPALPAVTDEEIKESLGKSFMNAQICDKITDRAVTKDDLVSLSFVGYMNGEEFNGGKGSKDFVTIYNGGGFIPGFTDGIIGATPGTEVSVDLTFPEDYFEELAGKAVTFKITVHHIYVPAEITDENAVKLTGDETMTAEKLKEECRKALEDTKKEKYETDKMAIIFKAIVGEAASITPPEEMVEYYYGQDVEYYKYYANVYGMTYEEMLADVGFTDETLRERARDNVMKDIAIYSIAKAENMLVTDAEYDEKLTEFASSLGASKEDLEEMYTRQELKEQMAYEAVYAVVESWQNIVTE